MPLGIGKINEARDHKKLNKKLSRAWKKVAKEHEKSTGEQGYYCTKLVEPVPILNKAECEKVISHENNQWIVFGRDRFSSRASGYGGEGHTQAGMIDMVVGRMGAGTDSDTFANPNFISDAARIYISQKADIDAYFGLPRGTVGISKARSAIGLKADAIRIVGREGVKITTSPVGSNNSQGGMLSTIYGIDLIAGNDDNIDTYLVADTFGLVPKSQMRLQPITKAFELADCLKEVADPADGLIGQLAGIVDTFVTYSMDLFSYIGFHTHIAPGFGAPTAPDPNLIIKSFSTLINDLALVKTQLHVLKANQLSVVNKYMNPSGARWIGSRHNRSN